MRDHKSAEADLLAVFGNSGNISDWWLSWRPPDKGMWEPADLIVRRMIQREADAWSPEQDVTVDLMKNEFASGGGLQGGTPELSRIRDELIRSGRRTLDWERRLTRRR